MNNKKNEKKDICMIVLSCFPSDPRVRREAEVLISSKHSVDIICVGEKHENSHEVYNDISIYRVMKNYQNKESVLKYVFLSLIFVILAFYKINQLYFKNKRKYDIIQIHNMPDYLVFIPFIQKIIGRKIILDLHDLTVELFSTKWSGIFNKMLIPLVKFVERISCNFADELITTSKGFQNSLIKRGHKPEKITLVLNTANESIFKIQSIRKWEYLQKDVKILYHGTVAFRFGIHLVIEAIHMLRKNKISANLSIYGKYDPSYRELLEDRVTKLGLDKSIKFNEYISQEKVARVIESVDLGIVPYVSDEFMNLALSTKTFEYVLMGLPVVASKIPSLTNIFDENCLFYFKPNDTKDLVNKIMDCINNPKISKEKIINAKKIYENYNWNKMSKRYLNLIEKL